jgi:hypothetical protein
MHIDCIKIRYNTIHIEFSISNFITIRYVSNFITIRYVSNFIYRILTRNKVQFRIVYIKLRYSQKRMGEEMKETNETKETKETRERE